ncbi:hypothetical protein [Streptomyces sp. NPDC005970]|uniref:hypothetical protein n=1 Tax=unclassified Streptomyces TaxID=2593676 RepID=UPI0033DCCD75
MTQHCYRCDTPTREAIAVLRAAASGPGCLRYLCQDCDRRWPRPDADLYQVLVALQSERQAT